MITAWQKVPRYWRCLLLVLVAIYLAYLLLANLFLNTPVGEWAINRKPEKFQLHWNSGSTFWPGRLQLNEVRITGQVKNRAWHVQAQEASGRIAVLALLRKEFRMPWVQVDEVSGGVAKVTSVVAPAKHKDNAWTLRFDRIASHSLRKGRFEQWQLTGNGEAEFGFIKQLNGGAMEVLPSNVHFSQARVTHADQEWLREGNLGVEFSMEKHRKEEAPGLAKLLKMRAHLTVQAAIASMEVSVDSSGHPITRMLPGRGKAQIDMSYAKGALLPGSRLAVDMPISGMDGKGVQRNEALSLRLDADRDISVQARVPPSTAARLSLDADMRLRGTDIPLQGGLHAWMPRASGHIKAHWRFESLRWLDALFIQAPWLALDGHGDVLADLEIQQGRPVAGSRVEVPRVGVQADVMDNRIRGTAHALVRLETDPAGQPLTRMDLKLEQFAMANRSKPGAPYVIGQNLGLTLQASGAVGHLRESAQGHLRFQNARVPDLRVYNRYLPQKHLRFEGGSGTLSADLSVDAGGGLGKGWISVAGRGARLRMAGIALRGDVNIMTRLQRADLRKRDFNLDGSNVQLRNVSFQEPGGESRSRWWATIQLPKARMNWDHPLSVVGTADIHMQNVGFLLSLFSKQRDYPKWVFKLIDSGQANVGGQVRWNGNTLVLDSMQANNNRFKLKARLKLQDERRTGNLYAEWGVLSLALDVKGGQRDFHLVRAKHWYDAQPAFGP